MLYSRTLNRIKLKYLRRQNYEKQVGGREKQWDDNEVVVCLEKGLHDNIIIK